MAYLPATVEEIQAWYQQFSLPSLDGKGDCGCKKAGKYSEALSQPKSLRKLRKSLLSIQPVVEEDDEDSEGPESLEDVKKLIHGTCKALKKERKMHIRQIESLSKLLVDYCSSE